MAFSKLHHVGLMVNGLGEAKRIFCDIMGLRVDEVHSPQPRGRHVPFDNVNIIEVNIGEVQIEVNSPNDQSSGSARFLSSRGGIAAFHHLSPYATAIREDAGALRAKGLQQILPPGTTEWNGEGPAFLHPRSCLGILLEIWPSSDYRVDPQYLGDGTFTRLHHAGVLVRDIDEARKFWVDTMGLKPHEARNRSLASRPGMPDCKLYHVSIGETCIELAQPTNPESELGKYVAERGTGGSAIHHVSLVTGNLDNAIAKVNGPGIEPLGEPVKNADGSRSVWFRPNSLQIPIEFVQE